MARIGDAAEKLRLAGQTETAPESNETETGELSISNLIRINQGKPVQTGRERAENYIKTRGFKITPHVGTSDSY